MNKKIVVLSGAGISAESGIKTFRDSDGLWEGHDVMEVTSLDGWRKNKALVLDFYNQRRRQLKDVLPNMAHLLIHDLEKFYTVVVVTQNVDDLHERAGSTDVVHLHGELIKVRSEINPNVSIVHYEDVHIGDLASDGAQLRPDIVWFGEAVPLIEQAIEHVTEADIIIIIGTSMQVYPAAGLVGYAARDTKIFYIDPAPKTNYELGIRKNLTVISEKATTGMQLLYDLLCKKAMI